MKATMRVLSSILGVLLFSAALFAQDGRILGTVTDQTGAVLPGATVTVTDTQRGVARTLTTDAAGEYNAPSLNPGTYTVRVEAKGFKTLDRQNIALEVGKEVRVDLTPQPGEQTQTVTVTEAIPLVDTASSTLGGALSNAEVNDLPLNGRNYQNLLSLRPGVVIQPGGSPWTQSTNNVRPDESAWMIDGVFNANFFDNRSVAGAGSPFTDMALILPIDAIQEFNLEENPKAEFGWKPGAVVNVGLRSGTNAFHGAAYAFGRDDSFDARNYYNTVGATLPIQLKQFGAVVGGRIIKDKLFFFAGYEGLRSQVSNAIGASAPATGAGLGPASSMIDAITGLQAKGIALSPLSMQLFGCSTAPVACTGGVIQGTSPTTTSYLSTFPNTDVSDNGVAKVDYNINSKNTIHGSLVTGAYTALGEDFPMVNIAWEDTVIQHAWTAVGNWIWTPTSSLVNEFRMGYNRFEFHFIPADTGVSAASGYTLNGVTYPINTGITSTGGFPTVTIAGYNPSQLGSRRGRPLEASPNPYYDYQDNISYLRGKHSLKFGVEFAHIEAESNSHDTRGEIDFGGANGLAPLQNFFAGTPTGGSLIVGNPALTVTFKSYAAFVQDDWRIAPRVMLNLGMRYSYVSPFQADNNALGNFDPAVNPMTGLVQQGQSGVGSTIWKPDYGNWSPRVGFAWDVTGKGTTVLRGGASIMYSMFALSSFTANPGISDVRGGTSLAGIPTGACQVAVPIGGACPAGDTFGGNITTGKVAIPPAALAWGSSALFGNAPNAVFSCTAAAPCSISSVNPNLRTPYMGNWNLGVQHAFNNNLSLEVGYVGNHGDNLTNYVDVNQCEIPNTGACVRPFAQYPFLQYINQVSNNARSNYNSLQSTLTKRLSHGFNFTAGYTYGHGLDSGSLNRMGPQVMDSSNPGRDYGASDFDIRHRFTLTANYAIPEKKALASYCKAGSSTAS